MNRRSFCNALACVGAVIGAGFASGREIASFFSKYGALGWLLVVLAVGVLLWLCWGCLKESGRIGAECWCDLFNGKGTVIRCGAQLCIIVLLIVTTGAMIAASGQMAALIWRAKYACLIGAGGTIAAAWIVGKKGLKLMGWISGILVVLFAAAVISVFRLPHMRIVHLANEMTLAQGLMAAVRAVAYAAMNLTLAIGVVCRSASGMQKTNWHTAMWFGVIMLLMLGSGHLLLTQYPEWLNESFPLVKIMARFGKDGFILSVVLMYLSVFTSLTAMLYALRCAAENTTESPFLQFAIVILLPSFVSLMGFSQIVDRLYAPAGLVSLLMVFYPVLKCGKA